MTLNEQAIRAAIEALRDATGGTWNASTAQMERVVCAYLSAAVPGDVAGLVERLRGEYRIPITDGLGPAGGDEPNNAQEFVRHFETPPIQHEAATALVSISTALAQKEEACRAAVLENARQREAIERLREALQCVASQKRTDELETSYDVEFADFENAYDQMIEKARAALASIGEAG